MRTTTTSTTLATVTQQQVVEQYDRLTMFSYSDVYSKKKLLKDTTYTLTIRDIQFGEEEEKIKCAWVRLGLRTSYRPQHTDTATESETPMMATNFDHVDDKCLLVFPNPSTTATPHLPAFASLDHSRWSVCCCCGDSPNMQYISMWLTLSSQYLWKENTRLINPKRFDKFNELGYRWLNFFFSTKCPHMSNRNFNNKIICKFVLSNFQNNW